MALLPPPQKSEPATPGVPTSSLPAIGRSANDRRRVWQMCRDALARPLADYWIIAGTSALLIGLGLMFVLSASSVYGQENMGDAFYYAKRQGLFLLVGLVAAVLLSRCSVQALRGLSWVAMGLAYLLMILTYTPLGVEVNGNQNWVQFGTPLLRIQPAEFAKLAVVLWSAQVFQMKQRRLTDPRHLLVPFLPGAGLLLLLVVFQGDMGTAVIIAAILAAMMWVVGTPKRVLLGLTGVGLFGTFVLTVTSANRMRRLMAYLNPAHDLDGTNMQATVGVYALATGGWFGTGIGASRQKWGSLPEAHTDYIFAVIGEEIGFVGAVLVLALFFVLGWAGLRVARRSESLFGTVVATGITTWFCFQALVNVGVVLRLLPVMGVPLPMLSYGGSALLANMMALGVLLALARAEPDARAAITGGRRTARVTAVVDARA